MVHLYLQVNTTIAMRTPLLCTCASHCFAHAQANALRMRAPLLCTCASHCFAHARPIALHMRAPLYRARPQFAKMLPGCHFEALYCRTKALKSYNVFVCFTISMNIHKGGPYLTNSALSFTNYKYVPATYVLISYYMRSLSEICFCFGRNL